MIAPYNCIVVANGSFPCTALPMELLQKASVIVACDGAVQPLHERGISPTAVVGDMDSIPDQLRIVYADRLHHIIDQEINDLTKAVRYAHSIGEAEVLILGATGLREDHTLGNISLLMEYAPMFGRVEMLSDYGLFTPLLHSATLPSLPDQKISLFSLSPGGLLTTEGLRWPITNRRLTAWWQGTLNEAISSSFTLHLDDKAQVLVYRSLI